MDVASRPTIPDQDEDGAVGDEDVLVASRVAATEVAAELAATLEAVQLGEAEELGSNDAKTWRQTLAQETWAKYQAYTVPRHFLLLSGLLLRSCSCTVRTKPRSNQHRRPLLPLWECAHAQACMARKPHCQTKLSNHANCLSPIFAMVVVAVVVVVVVVVVLVVLVLVGLVVVVELIKPNNKTFFSFCLLSVSTALALSLVALRAPLF